MTHACIMHARVTHVITTFNHISFRHDSGTLLRRAANLRRGRTREDKRAPTKVKLAERDRQLRQAPPTKRADVSGKSEAKGASTTKSGDVFLIFVCVKLHCIALSGMPRYCVR